MGRMSRIGRRFMRDYSTIDGTLFKGQILDIPDTTRVTNFHSARRLMRVNDPVCLSPGDLFDSDGVRYLVAKHGRGVDYTHYKLFEMTERDLWERRHEVEDPVTGLKNVDAYKKMATIMYASEAKTNFEDRMKIPADRDIIITNAPLERNDRVGGRVVYSVDNSLGVTVAEVRE